MRRTLKTGIFLGVALIASWSFAQDTPEEAYASLAERWVQDWNDGDMAAIAALYTEDGDVMGANGQMASGRAEIESYLSELKAGPLAGTTLSVGEATIDCVTENTCITDNSYEFSGAAPSSGLTTIVMTKQGDQWLIAAHRSRVPIPSGQ